MLVTTLRCCALFVFSCYYAASALLFEEASTHRLISQKELRRDAWTQDLVIVRTVGKPAPGMIRRMKAYAEDFNKNLPDAAFVISVDTTKDPISFKIPGDRKHEYNWNAVKVAFPRMPDNANVYRYRIEPAVLAADYMRVHYGVYPDYVWTIEDDLVFCGSLTDLVQRYREDTSDFLSIGGPQQWGGNWPNVQRGSPEFLDKYPTQDRRMCTEHIQRLSNNFLQHLAKVSREEGITAESEMFPATVAFHSNFSKGHFQHQHEGELGVTHTISEEHAEELCAKVPRGEVVFHHAGKFLQEGASRPQRP